MGKRCRERKRVIEESKVATRVIVLKSNDIGTTYCDYFLDLGKREREREKERKIERERERWIEREREREEERERRIEREKDREG